MLDLGCADFPRKLFRYSLADGLSQTSVIPGSLDVDEMPEAK